MQGAKEMKRDDLANELNEDPHGHRGLEHVLEGKVANDRDQPTQRKE